MAVVVMYGRMLRRPRDRRRDLRRHARPARRVGRRHRFPSTRSVRIRPWPRRAGGPVGGGQPGGVRKLRFGPSAGAIVSPPSLRRSRAARSTVPTTSLNPLRRADHPRRDVAQLRPSAARASASLTCFLYLIVGRLHHRLDGGGGRPEYLGRKGRGPRDEAGHARPAGPPTPDPKPRPACSPGTGWGGPTPSANPGAHGFQRNPVRVQFVIVRQRLGVRGAGDTWGFQRPKANPSPPRTLQPPLGRRVRPSSSCSAASLPIVAPLALVGGLSTKAGRARRRSGRCAPTPSPFGVVLLGTVPAARRASSFLPAAVLGPVAETPRPPSRSGG